MIVAFYELFVNTVFPEKFTREQFKLPDGGTLGLEWDGGIPDMENEQENAKPLLLIVPGLGLDSQNLYTLAMLWKARQAGYKVCTLNFRGADGIPLTSPKLNHSGCWKDLEFALDWVNKKYVINAKTGEKRRRFFCFGASLGAIVLGNYLGRAGPKTKEVLDGAVLYGTLWNSSKGWEYF